MLKIHSNRLAFEPDLSVYSGFVRLIGDRTEERMRVFVLVLTAALVSTVSAFAGDIATIGTS